MKLLHIADLHIGKRVNEYSMLEDQRYILGQILKIVEEEKIDGVIIAGDVYDKSLPPAEAVALLDEFLTKLVAYVQAVFMISGNHDSPERIGFGSKIMEKNHFYIAGVFDGKLNKITLNDKFGNINFYMLPFIKPAMLRPFYEETVDTYDEAVKLVVSNSEINKEERNILIAHQFIINGNQKPERSDSETVSVGGLDCVDVSAFDPFDYVALGHIHRPQNIGRKTVRYSGSPLKYSFSEAKHEKSVTIIDLNEKDNLTISTKPLIPIRDLREIKGPMKELLRIGRLEKESSSDYMHITLTDDEEIYDAIGQLRQVYPNLMVLDFENNRSGQVIYDVNSMADTSKKSPLELFQDFYYLQNNEELSKEQIDLLNRVMEE